MSHQEFVDRAALVTRRAQMAGETIDGSADAIQFRAQVLLCMAYEVERGQFTATTVADRFVRLTKQPPAQPIENEGQLRQTVEREARWLMRHFESLFTSEEKQFRADAIDAELRKRRREPKA
jgi:hypothetical protein